MPVSPYAYGSLSRREKVRMRETRSKKSFFRPLTLALSLREREFLYTCGLKLGLVLL
jgi:hypothetical protein